MDNLPEKDLKLATEYMDESEVVTRIMFVLNNFKIYNLKTLDWQKPWDQ